MKQPFNALLAAFAAIALTASPARADDTQRVKSFTSYPKPRPFKSRPHIPVYMIPMEALEPPRDVPARAWVSPYCTAWTDGEEFCEKSDPLRKSAPSDARCKPVQSSFDVTTRVKIQGVSCLWADLKALEQVCYRSMLYDPGIPIPYVKSLSRWQRNGGAYTEEKWIWKSGRWTNGAVSNADMGSSRQDLIKRGLLREDIPDLRTFYCVEGYSKDTPWRLMKDAGDVIRPY